MNNFFVPFGIHYYGLIDGIFGQIGYEWLLESFLDPDINKIKIIPDNYLDRSLIPCQWHLLQSPWHLSFD
jgi:hypothetical protein